MFFRLLYEDDLAHGAYLVGCQQTGEAIVIDPARDVDRYLEEARRQGLRIVAAAETHIHADFLSGARELAESHGARLFLSDEGDADWKYGWLDRKKNGGSYDCRLLKDGDTFSIGKIEFRVMHTPGHTPEHVSFVVSDLGGGADAPMGVFTGDFVFVGDMGRPDLLETAAGQQGVKENSARSLGRSAGKFLDLPDFLQVWPAHGAGSACGKALGAVPQSTVGYERSFNGALRLAEREDDFVDFILAGQPEPPLYFGRMKVQNRDGVPLLGTLPRPRRMDVASIRKNAENLAQVVVDTRPWSGYRRGHLPGALHAPIGASFHPVVGSYVAPEEPIVLVAEVTDVEPAIRALVRIGLDQVIGIVDPADLAGLGPVLVETSEIGPDELQSRLESGDAFVLDVRRAAELQEGSIHAAAVHVAHTRLPEALERLPADRPIHVHCATGRRSAAACSYLARRGYEAINLRGGFRDWRDSGHDVVRPHAAAGAAE